MTQKQKELIKSLLKEFSGKHYMQDLIGYISETTGLLDSVRRIVAAIQTNDSELLEWLEEACESEGVDPHLFLKEFSGLVNLFDSDNDDQDHYAILGLNTGASSDEVKKAYRTLSLQYHPDVATKGEEGATDRFIEINRAYHALTAEDEFEADTESYDSTPSASNWWPGEKPSISPTQKKSVWVAGIVILSILFVFTIFSAISFRKQSMLTGLQDSRGAFIPPPSQHSVSEKNANELKQIDVTIPVAEKTVSSTPSSPNLDVNTNTESSYLEEKAEVEPISIDDVKILAPVEGKKRARDSIEFDKNDSNTDLENANQEFSKIESVADELRRSVSREREKFSQNQTNIPVEVEDVDQKHLDNNSIEVAPSQNEVLKTQIEKFLHDYEKAYAKRNIILFSQLFHPDATENGKPFVEMVSEYDDLFKSTNDVILKINMDSWQKKHNGDISLNGSFNVGLDFKDGGRRYGAGSIFFVLSKDEKFLVRDLTYRFD